MYIYIDILIWSRFQVTKISTNLLHPDYMGVVIISGLVWQHQRPHNCHLDFNVADIAN